MPHSGNTRVLVVEDDVAIQRFLRNTLQVHDYDVRIADTGADGIRSARQLKPEIVILDLGLPDTDGMEVIKSIRAFSAVPIIVLSSRSDEAGKVAALDSGADDFISKPFGVDELMARLRTAMRHRLASEGSLPIFETGGLKVDLTHRIVTVDGREVKLSRKEYDILRELVVHAGKVLTHGHLLKLAWDRGDAVDVQYLRVYIRQIRQKIEATPERPVYILTEPGVGYRLHVFE
jgi:two-component system KDP operon response regulator KdpE